MRLWTVHPKYIDTKGFVALWREALLAREVLKGKTKGWVHHPQLDRFKAVKNPLPYINTYLKYIYEDSCRRGYCFDKSKLSRNTTKLKLKVSRAFLKKEISDLKAKLKKRDPVKYRELLKTKRIELNPVFRKH